MASPTRPSLPADGGKPSSAHLVCNGQAPAAPKGEGKEYKSVCPWSDDGEGSRSHDEPEELSATLGGKANAAGEAYETAEGGEALGGLVEDGRAAEAVEGS